MTTTTTVHIYARDNNGTRWKWEDQDGAIRAINRGLIAAAQIAGFPPVYALNQDNARGLALRKARRHMRNAKIIGEPGPCYTWDLCRVTTDTVTP